MMKQDLVSIIIPVYNGEKFIKESIESCLNQTYKEIEIIVVNDGSIDDTLNVIRQLEQEHNNVKVISYEKNQGKVYALNQGINIAQGKYIAIQAADDVCFEYRIESSINKIKESIENVLVHGDMLLVDEKLNVLAKSYTKKENICIYADNQTEYLLQSNFVSGGTILMVATIKENIFPIPNELAYEDWWIAIMASLIGRLVYIDSPLIKYRKHSSNANNRVVRGVNQYVEQRINVTKRNLQYYKCLKDYFQAFNSTEKFEIRMRIIEISKLRDECILTNKLRDRLKLINKEIITNIKDVIIKEKIKLLLYIILGRKLLNYKCIVRSIKDV